jgi:hypothetical protein
MSVNYYLDFIDEGYRNQCEPKMEKSQTCRLVMEALEEPGKQEQM